MRRRIFALRLSVSGLRYQMATLVQYLQKRLCLDHGRETSMQTTKDQQHLSQLPRTQSHLPSPYICTPRTVRHESHLINMTHKLKYLKSNVLMTCIAKHGYQVTRIQLNPGFNETNRKDVSETCSLRMCRMLTRWEIRGWGDLMRGLAFWYGFFFERVLGGGGGCVVRGGRGCREIWGGDLKIAGR